MAVAADHGVIRYLTEAVQSSEVLHCLHSIGGAFPIFCHAGEFPPRNSTFPLFSFNQI
jgi:hypothetical protein